MSSAHGASRKFVVRHGHSLCYVYSALEAAAVMSALSIPTHAASSLDGCDHGSNDFAAIIGTQAHHALDILVAHFPLEGRARKSLGTALRVLCVRKALPKELLVQLQFISDGADAFRHLVQTDIGQTVVGLQRFCKDQPGKKDLGEDLEPALSSSSSLSGKKDHSEGLEPSPEPAAHVHLQGIRSGSCSSAVQTDTPGFADVSCQYANLVFDKVPGRGCQASPAVSDSATQVWASKKVQVATQSTSTLLRVCQATSTMSCSTASRKTQTRARLASSAVQTSPCLTPVWINHQCTQTPMVRPAGGQREDQPVVVFHPLRKVKVARFRGPDS
uniref:Uncharacterized protein n=1 Tax=Alexandrium fundyense TaxID=2932 RepID=A4UHD9_ALEFU|nr:unknown [Alexandrium fundyense]